MSLRKDTELPRWWDRDLAYGRGAVQYPGFQRRWRPLHSGSFLGLGGQLPRAVKRCHVGAAGASVRRRRVWDSVRGAPSARAPLNAPSILKVLAVEHPPALAAAALWKAGAYANRGEFAAVAGSVAARPAITHGVAEGMEGACKAAETESKARSGGARFNPNPMGMCRRFSLVGTPFERQSPSHTLPRFRWAGPDCEMPTCPTTCF